MKRSLVLLAGLLSACSAGPRPTPAPPPKPAAPAVPPKPSVSLDNPADPAFAKPSPATFKARFRTTKGTFVIEVTREWAPRGADRFHALVKHGFYNQCRFFRVIGGFMAQFGINGDPKVAGAWRDARIEDDPVVSSNTRGKITFATAGPNTRTTQLFINTADNARLDEMGFSPFGRVVDGMKVVDALYSGYGEGAPMGRGPNQGRIQQMGNAYLTRNYPKLDIILEATIEE